MLIETAQGGQSRAAHADQAHEIVELATLRSRRWLAISRLGKPRASRISASRPDKNRRLIHLPKPLLGVQKTLGKKQILFVGGETWGTAWLCQGL